VSSLGSSSLLEKHCTLNRVLPRKAHYLSILLSLLSVKVVDCEMWSVVRQGISEILFKTIQMSVVQVFLGQKSNSSKLVLFYCHALVGDELTKFLMPYHMRLF
jgi:hypothetical protein